MELPISFRQNIALFKQLQQYTESIFAPFLRETPHIQENSFIMPLYLVETALHDHYVTTQSIWVTYEFYDKTNKIQQTTILVTVQSTVLPDRRIVLKELNQNRSLILDLEQILTVSANIAE